MCAVAVKKIKREKRKGAKNDGSKDDDDVDIDDDDDDDGGGGRRRRTRSKMEGRMRRLETTKLLFKLPPRPWQDYN